MVWTVPFWCLLALGLFDPGLWTWPRIAAPLAAIGLTLVHFFFWTDLRMRAPIVPVLAADRCRRLRCSSISRIRVKSSSQREPAGHGEVAG